MIQKDLTEVRALFKEREVMEVKYSLVLIDAHSGAFNFHHGVVKDSAQLLEFKKAMQNLEKSEIEYATVAMGKVDCFFDREVVVSLEPVFHPTEDTYKNLLYVDNELCLMPSAIRELLELWRKS